MSNSENTWMNHSLNYYVIALLHVFQPYMLNWLGSIHQCIVVRYVVVFSSIEDKHDLMSELNLMQGIDSHQNVVELLGCVTEKGTITIMFLVLQLMVCAKNFGVNYKA